MNRVDIVVPVYNERENFENLLRHLEQAVRSDWRLLVVYDIPEDTTLHAARPAAEKNPRIQLVRNESRGALAAIKTGFRTAEAEAVLLIMVDDPPSVVEKIDALVERFYATGATIVVASRYMRGGSHVGGPMLKGILSRLAGVSLHYVIRLPTHDATYATRLYRTSFLQSVTIEAKKGFELTLELTLKAYFSGGRIEEIPVAWKEREVGTSRFHLLKWLPAYLSWYVWGVATYCNPFARKKLRSVSRT